VGGVGRACARVHATGTGRHRILPTSLPASGNGTLTLYFADLNVCLGLMLDFCLRGRSSLLLDGQCCRYSPIPRNLLRPVPVIRLMPSVEATPFYWTVPHDYTTSPAPHTVVHSNKASYNIPCPGETFIDPKQVSLCNAIELKSSPCNRNKRQIWMNSVCLKRRSGKKRATLHHRWTAGLFFFSVVRTADSRRADHR